MSQNNGDDRLPADTRLGTVRLQVSDLGRSVPYYQDMLGFQATETSPGRATLVAKGSSVPLIELHERSGATPAPGRGRLGLYHYAILLPDRAALGRFVTHLAERGERAGAADHLVSEALYLHDPDNLGIEVCADRPRSEWRWRDGELAMASDPLDLTGLARAGAGSGGGGGGGERWIGMPAGTTIGHIHLHVGDLEGAEAFYGSAVGLAPVVRSYPSALFLAAGGYHHHLGVNTWAGPGAQAPGDGEARLLEWELVLPAFADVEAAAARVRAGGHAVEQSDGGWTAHDPWGTRLRMTAASR